MLSLLLQEIPFTLGQMYRFRVHSASACTAWVVFALHHSCTAVEVQKVDFKLLADFMHLLKGRFHNLLIIAIIIITITIIRNLLLLLKIESGGLLIGN